LIDYFLVFKPFYPTAKLVLKNKLVFNSSLFSGNIVKTIITQNIEKIALS
jgi:hypothetical protein